MTTALEAITTAGVYDIPAEVYHADPVPWGSLSSTGARKLLPPSVPAKFEHDRRNPRVPTRTFNLGSAAHRVVLGAGADLVDVPFPNYRKDAAQEIRDASWAAGNIPVLPDERAQVDTMVGVLRGHMLAGALLEPGSFHPERTMVWEDQATGVWCRAMADALKRGNTRWVIVDYKTCDQADPYSVSRSVARYGYHQQDAWYREGAVATGIDDDPGFVFVFQEKAPPYLVDVVYLDSEALEVGRARNRRAREIFRDCTEAGLWPEYPMEVTRVSLPRWAARELGEEF
jgi:hypothetical protein